MCYFEGKMLSLNEIGSRMDQPEHVAEDVIGMYTEVQELELAAEHFAQTKSSSYSKKQLFEGYY